MILKIIIIIIPVELKPRLHKSFESDMTHFDALAYVTLHDASPKTRRQIRFQQCNAAQ